MENAKYGSYVFSTEAGSSFCPHEAEERTRFYNKGTILNNATKKLLATEYFLLRGLPWIYQGQEIGMENIKVNSIDEIDDISSIDAYQVALDGGAAVEEALEAVAKYSRDNARTPFQWSAAAQAGFTTGTPWLRLNPNFKGINLETEMADPDSIYHYYKKLIALRKDPADADALVYGSFVPYLQHCSGIMRYLRCGGGQNILVMGNFNSAPQTLPLPEGMKIRKILLGNLSDSCVRAGDTGEITLQKYEAIVSEVG